MNKLKYILIVFLLLNVHVSFAQKTSKKDKGKNKTETVGKSSSSEENKINAERLFFDGQKEKLIGNLEEAYNLFNQSIKLDPSIDAAYYEIAIIQQMGGDLVSAQKNMEKALELSPKNEWYMQFNGDLFASQFQYDKAAEVFHSLRTNYPKVYDYYFDEAYYLILSGKMKESLDVYNEIEKQIGVQPDASLQKYKILSRLNKPDEAAAELQKLIDAYPDELEFKNDLAEFYVLNNQEEKGIALYTEILEQDPTNILAITSLADYYKRKGEDEKYLKFSKMAFENPDIPVDAKISVLFNYIKFYDQRKEEIQDAFDLAELLIKAHPKEAKAYAIAGDLYNLNEQAEKALDYYYQSLDYQKDVFTVWQQVFFINSDLKQYDELIKNTNDAKEYFPNQALVYFFNGLGYQQQKNVDEAEKAYNRGVKMCGDNFTLKSQFYSNLGDLYNDTKDYEASDENFDKALELNPKNAYVLNNYSYYLSLRGENLEKAAEMSKTSNDLEPLNSSFLDTYAWILYKQGKYNDAYDFQQKAIKASDEPSATLLEHLGDILFKQGKKDEAISQWKKAADVGGGSDLLPKKVQDGTLYE